MKQLELTTRVESEKSINEDTTSKGRKAYMPQALPIYPNCEGG